MSADRGSTVFKLGLINPNYLAFKEPCRQWELVEWAVEEKVSVGRPCRVVGIHRSKWYYRSRKDNELVIKKLRAYAEIYPTRGFDDYYGKLRNEGFAWNRITKAISSSWRSMRPKFHPNARCSSNPNGVSRT